MDDLVSRQAAIEVIDAVFPVDPMKSEYAQGIACGAALSKTYVEQLPSVQPEIIRCKDCKYSEHWYRDKRRCFLWVEDGIDVFDDGFCNYAKRRTNG